MTKKTHARPRSFIISFSATHHFLFVLSEITFTLLLQLHWSHKLFQAHNCSTMTVWRLLGVIYWWWINPTMKSNFFLRHRALSAYAALPRLSSSFSPFPTRFLLNNTRPIASLFFNLCPIAEERFPQAISSEPIPNLPVIPVNRMPSLPPLKRT